MKKISLLILVLLAIATPLPSMAWSSKGHQTVAYIAWLHLTDKSRAATTDILQGATMPSVASWLDYARNESQYAYTSTWHYINVDENETYETRYKNPAGDAITAIIRSLSTLEEEDASATEKNVAMKILIHVVGDLHQPMHTGHKTDLGGNTININFMGESMSLHSMWDYSLVESAHPGWNYYTWAVNIDKPSASEQKKIVSSTIDDWARENVSLAADVYEAFPYGKKVTASDVAAWTPIIEQQFVRAGLRLAHLINAIFDPSHNGASVTDIIADTAENQADIYSIDGRLVLRNSTRKHAANILPQGLYIQRGDKFIIR